MVVRIEVIGGDGNVIDIDAFRRASINQARQTAKAIEVDFKVTTRTWKTKVEFERKIISDEQIDIFTTSKIYLFVSGGTKAHIIRAKNAPNLLFQVGYNRKTQPNRIASYNGGSFGPYRKTKQVNHPGSKARKFDTTIKKKWDREFPRQYQRAVLSQI